MRIHTPSPPTHTTRHTHTHTQTPHRPHRAATRTRHTTYTYTQTPQGCSTHLLGEHVDVVELHHVVRVLPVHRLACMVIVKGVIRIYSMCHVCAVASTDIDGENGDDRMRVSCYIPCMCSHVIDRPTQTPPHTPHPHAPQTPPTPRPQTTYPHTPTCNHTYTPGCPSPHGGAPARPPSPRTSSPGAAPPAGGAPAWGGSVDWGGVSVCFQSIYIGRTPSG